MKENKNNYVNVNSRWKSLIKPLFTFFIIGIPSLFIWIFFSKDFPFAEHFSIDYNWWIKLLIALAFIVGTLLLTLLFIYFKMLEISILMFSLPVSICFMAIFLTDTLTAWIRAIIIIPIFLLVIPICILIKKIEFHFIIKSKTKNQNQNDKPIGYK